MEAYLDQKQIQKKRRVARLKIYLIGFGVIILLFGLVYAAIYSPALKVNNFRVQDNERLSQESVLAILRPLVIKGPVANFLGWQNLFAWPSGEVDVSKTSLFSATVSKDWLNRAIVIEVKERERFDIWCIKGAICYWMDRDGILFEEAPLTDGGLILKIYDPQKTELVLGESAIEGRFVKNLILALDGLRGLDVSIEKIVFDRKLQELEINTYGGPTIFSSIRFDPALNLNSLKKLSETLDFGKISYIDIRVENRVYYKNK